MNCRGCPGICLVQRLEGWGGSLSYSTWDPHRVADGGACPIVAPPKSCLGRCISPPGVHNSMEMSTDLLITCAWARECAGQNIPVLGCDLLLGKGIALQEWFRLQKSCLFWRVGRALFEKKIKIFKLWSFGVPARNKSPGFIAYLQLPAFFSLKQATKVFPVSF